jgi:hypothetical protein
MNAVARAVLLVAPLTLACGSPPTEDEGSTGDVSSTTGSTGTSATGPTEAPTSGDPTGSTSTVGATGDTGTTVGVESSTSPTESTTTTTESTEPADTSSETSSSSESSSSESSGETSSGETSSGEPSTGETTAGETTEDTTTGENPLLAVPHLWYAVDDSLMYIELDPADGSAVTLVQNDLVADQPLVLGQNGLTMLKDGSLLGSRESAAGTQIYHVAAPPTAENTPAQAVYLGMVPTDGNSPLRIEALYTDCDGRVYLMDTGSDVVNSSGNRLLRFSGMYLAGDLNFEVITNLQNASVGDIDDMSPGIVDGEVNDKFGFAIDSGNLWQIDYITGTGMNLAASDGDYGVHALGGPLFDDSLPRLYVLSAGDISTGEGARLFQVDLMDYTSSGVLIEGPDFDIDTGFNGWSGLAGPLTECITAIPQ